MGALLALPPSINFDSLGFETTPGKILATAFMDYGAYVVDDSAWDDYDIATEWGPDGRFIDEFEKNWGFPFYCNNMDSPWGRDILRIFRNLHVIDNNTSNNIGGGGTPRKALANPLIPYKKFKKEIRKHSK